MTTETSDYQDAKHHPLITIITVVYNGEDHIAQTLLSLKVQKYKNIEHIIIDGQSSDATPAIISKTAPFFTRVIREPDNGLYDAMNKGIDAASGDVIAFLNSDDWYNESTIKNAAACFDSNPNLKLVYGNIKKWDSQNNPAGHVGSKELRSDLMSTPFSHPACFARKEVFKEIGKFDTSFEIVADYDWMLRFKTAKLPYEYSPTIETNFRLTGLTGSAQFPPVKELYLVLTKNGTHSISALTFITVRVLRSILSPFYKKITSALNTQ